MGKSSWYVGLFGKILIVGLLIGFAVIIFPSVAFATPVTTLATDPISENGLNQWFVTPTNVTLTNSDLLGKTWYSWVSASGPWTQYFFPISPTEGQSTFYYYSEDSTGTDLEVVRNKTFKVDTIPPTASINSPASLANVSGTVTLMGTVSDTNFTQYTVEYGAGRRPSPHYNTTKFNLISGSQLAAGTWWRTLNTSSTPVTSGTLSSLDTTKLDNSYHTFRLIAEDDAGNKTVKLLAVNVNNAGRAALEEVTLDGLDSVPDISADNSKIAFSSDRTGNNEIWLADADGSNLFNVTESTYDDLHPSLSPDGLSLVFMSDRDGDYEIYKINVNGSGLTKLTNNTWDDLYPTWGGNGDKIVYCSKQSGNNDIFVVDANGSNQTSLTNSAANDIIPDISPDGTKIVFTSNRNGSNDNYIMNIDGSAVTQITNSPGEDGHPSFSSNGQRIFFRSDRSGNLDIWSVGIDGSDIRHLTDDPAIDTFPTCSSDGTKVVYSSGRSGLCDIYLMNSDGSNDQRVTFSTSDFIPDISFNALPDPEPWKIAFSSNRGRNYTSLNNDVRDGDIFLTESDGSNMNIVSNPEFLGHHPSFSPDGQKIAFCSYETASWEVWTMNLDGSGVSQVTAAPGRKSTPTWGASGRIVYSSDSAGNDDVYIVNQDGSSPVALTTSLSEDLFADISSDGSKIAFSTPGSAPGDLYLMDSDGSNLTQLTSDPMAGEWHPSLSPNATRVMYILGGTNTDLYLMNTSGGGVSRLTYDIGIDTVATWGADGNTAIFSTTRTSGQNNANTIWKMIIQDTEDPITCFETPPNPDGNNGWYVTDPDIHFVRNEPGTTYYSWTSSSGPWFQYVPPIATPQGTNTIYYYSVDNANNEETVKSQTFKVDTSPPIAEAGQTQSVNEADSVTFNAGSSYDNQSPIVSYEWDFDSDGNYDRTTLVNTTKHAFESPGVCTTTVRVTNDAGLSTTDTVTTTVNDLPGRSFQRLSLDTASDWQPEYNPAGNKVAYTSNAIGNYDIWVMNSDGSGKIRLTNDSNDDQHPSFSADGNKIIFTSGRSGNGDIYKMNTDGSNVVQLTNSGDTESFPNFSPDGSKIAYVRYEGTPGNANIWMMNADGSGQTRVTQDDPTDPQNNPAEEIVPDWSPAGDYILYTSNKAGNKDIWRVQPSGAGKTQLTSNPAVDQHPSQKFNGSRTVFWSERDGNQELYLMNNDGTNQQRLTTNPADDKIPCFSRQGDRIVYVTKSEGYDDMWAVNLEITPPSVPSNLAATPMGSSQIDLSWNASTDSSGVAGYTVLSDSYSWLAYATTNNLKYLKASPSSTLSFRVNAYDKYGNMSSASSSVQASTTASDMLWTSKAAMPTARSALGVAALNGKIYAIGGGDTEWPYRGMPLSTVEVYDPSSNSWTTGAPMPTPRGTRNLAVVNGKIYAIGGWNGVSSLATVEEYNPSTDSWVSKQSLPSPQGVMASGSIVVNGKIYAIGGTAGSLFTNPQPLNTVREYDPLTNTWTDKAPMPTARFLAAAAVYNNKIYVFGGKTEPPYVQSNRLNIVEEFNPSTNTWQTKAPLPESVYACSASTIGNKIYVVGGNNGQNSKAVFCFDPALNNWKTMTSMINNKGVHGSAVINNKIYTIGGLTGTQGALNYVEEGTLLGDAIPPTAPTDVQAIALDSDSVYVSWNASTDNVGVVGYRLINEDYEVLVTDTSALSYTINGLPSAIETSYYVKAYDALGNESPASAVVSVTTFPDPVSTPAGSNVTTDLGNGVALNFNTITSSGTTTVTVQTTPSLDPPSNFRFQDGGYYNITTTSSYTGFIYVTFPYEETSNEAALRLFHWENGAWGDVTTSVDIANNTITGRVTSLSPFGVGEPEGGGPTTGANKNVIALLSVLAVLLGIFVMRHNYEKIGFRKVC